MLFQIWVWNFQEPNLFIVIIVSLKQKNICIKNYTFDHQELFQRTSLFYWLDPINVLGAFLKLRRFYSSDRFRLIHWIKVRQCAFRLKYNLRTTCRWPSHMISLKVPQATDKILIGCTGISEILKKGHIINIKIDICIWVKKANIKFKMSNKRSMAHKLTLLRKINNNNNIIYCNKITSHYSFGQSKKFSTWWSASPAKRFLLCFR